MLESTNKDNSISNEKHIRMRGIPTTCIKYYAQQNSISALDTCNEVYEGKEITFDVTKDLTKFVCKSNRDHTVSNVTKFTRTTTYIRDGNDKTLNLSLFLFDNV